MIPRQWGRVKPPLGTPINPGHLLGRGLIGAWAFNEIGSSLVRDLAGTSPMTLISTADWAVSASRVSPTGLTSTGGFVRGLRTNAGAEEARGLASAAIKKPFPLTLVWRGVFLAAPTDASNAIAITHSDNPATVPYMAAALHLYSTTLYVGSNDGAAWQAWNTGWNCSNLIGPITQFAATWKTSERKLYHDGKLVATTTGHASPAYTATSRVQVGNWDGARPTNTITDYALIYDRALSADEIRQLWLDPYGWLAPPAPRRLSRASPKGIKRRLLEEGLFAEYPGGSRRRS